MKIALAFFGVPRCSRVSFPSIERHLLAPLAALGELRVFHHLYRQDRVFNPRSAEDHVLDASNYAPFARFEGVLQERPAELPALFHRLKAHGDAWADGFHSLANCVLQLQSLLAVTQQAARADADVVVFARPDLLYLEPVEAHDVGDAAAQPDLVLLPRWESWGGFNDRFAIAGRAAWRAYGGRVLLAPHYCERTGKPLHAETFLAHALAFAGVPVRTIALRACRVRTGGWAESEDFDGRRTPFATGTETGRPGR